MSYLDHQLQPVGGREPVGEVLRPVGLQMLAHDLDGVKDPEQLAGVGWRKPAYPIDEGSADQPEQPAGEGIPRDGGEVGRRAGSLVPDGRAQLRQVSRSFLAAGSMLDHPLPFGFSPQHRLAQSIPQRGSH
jgi:hypothetical protein